MKKHSLLFLLWMVSLPSLNAQRKILLEQMRCFSASGPTMQYLLKPAIRQIVSTQLQQVLLEQLQVTLADTTLPVLLTADPYAINKQAARFTDTDTANWHLYIDLFEFEPLVFFVSHKNLEPDSTLFKRSSTVFQLGIIVANHQKQIIADQVLNICVTRGNTQGFGVMPRNMAVTGKGFTDMLKLGLGMVLNPKNETGMIEIKAPPPFFADNFILPELKNQPRVMVKAQKDIFTYNYQGNDEMVRMGEALYDEIQVKGKRRNLAPDHPISLAIEKTGNSRSSDFIFLRQECRDVLRDKNYTIRLVTELNPYAEVVRQAEIFTHFLPGYLHTLMEEKDTLARFMITKTIGIPEKKIYLQQITNGYDSSSLIEMSQDPTPRNMLYEYQLEGWLKDEQPFKIQCSDYNHLKEIYYNGKRVCITSGRFLPERFVVFDASLPNEILNRLLILAFTRFYE